MNRVKLNLLSASMMTPAERAMGRFMRAPDHPGADDTGGGGGDSTTAGDNTGGNDDDSGNKTPTEDNDGLSDELKGFWDNKDEPPTTTESDEETATQSKALGAELGGIINSFKTPEVFTKEIADQIANGDLNGVNAALEASNKALMQHQVVVTAKLLGGVIDRLSADFDQRIQRAFGNKDSEIALETHFPLATDPTMRPLVKRVWDQALTTSKGDKQKAIRLTKGMLEAFGNKTSIRDAPEDPTAGIGTNASKSLVADLLARD
jgi:hypothetical protein